ncbi:MBL fold metallo-hydrolase [Streptomyces barkulensis]|uniref:MBL fold metallo-hydrolase n=1 Tax=Streptomyces barkulensis TaxID=1257026 RepID=UPI003F6C5DB6
MIVQDGDPVTLVDTGCPKDRELLLASLHAVGADPSAVAAVLVTHAHSDHICSAEYLRTRYGIPVLAHREEVPHARRDFLQQVSVGRIAAGAWRPGVLPWAVRALRSGGKRVAGVRAAAGGRRYRPAGLAAPAGELRRLLARPEHEWEAASGGHPWCRGSWTRSRAGIGDRSGEVTDQER